MSLYNLKSADGQWRITKFTNDLDVESSYLLSESECGCPAGSRPTCRHRTMLPKMLEVGAEDSGLFYDFDSDKFFEPLGEGEPDLVDVTSVIAEPTCADEDASAASGSSDTEPKSGLVSGNLSQVVEYMKQANDILEDGISSDSDLPARDANEIESDLSRAQIGLEPYGKSPGLDEMLAESRADNERMKAKIIAIEDAHAVRSAELGEPEPEPSSLEGSDQTAIITINYNIMTDGSVRIDEAHPSIGHIKRRI